MKDKLKEAIELVRAFNAKPPTWAYWVAGIFIILAIRMVRFL